MKNWIRKLAAFLLAALLTAALPVTAFAKDGEDETPELDERIEAALEWGLRIAADNSHGYSKYSRFGPNYDCSSFVSAALMHGGFDLGYTSTCGMKEALEELGFTAYRKGEVELRRGDILLNPWEHVEFYLGDGMCLAAHMDYDGRSGDSTGKEINIREGQHCAFCRNRTYSWILRCPAPEPAREPEPIELPEPKLSPEPVFVSPVESEGPMPVYPMPETTPGRVSQTVKAVSAANPDNAMER